MDSKCKYWMLLLTLLCVISLGFSLFRVFPCEVGNETFLGIYEFSFEACKDY